MKRKVFSLTLILVMIFSAVVGIQFNLGSANPYIRDFVEEREMPAPEGTEPITILIISPENCKVYSSSNISLNFNISWPESIDFFWLFQIYYNASWQPNKTNVDYGSSARSITINLTEIPEGSHQLEVVAVAKYTGYISHQEIKNNLYLTAYYVSYRLNGSSIVNFTIDLPPKISILSLGNKTYSAPNVELDFAVNEPISEVAYSLDGKENVTIAGNTTLTGLSNGAHNVTVYAWDAAGNTGASETIQFNVEAPEPFPTTLVATVSAASVAIIGIGSLFYFRKHRH
ncbi:hypothetical protein G4O51_03775 [Candidatus Bathyarchaeota archaeon A05DMB-2]|jgi:hypothetical protein|nr:hypothetical protein [Candidatus Bathyarchaeota archaeon A05DMB-2]